MVVMAQVRQQLELHYYFLMCRTIIIGGEWKRMIECRIFEGVRFKLGDPMVGKS
jgi:hypothetical protein